MEPSSTYHLTVAGNNTDKLELQLIDVILKVGSHLYHLKKLGINEATMKL